MTDQELMLAAAREVRSAGADELGMLRLNAIDAIALLGNLQLALRHQANHGPSSMKVRVLAAQLETMLAQVGTATMELARRGWDPAYDPEPE